jgi:hypothetical protein
MSLRDGISWQLILADLALILFLVGTSALTEDTEPSSLDADVPAQAVYRPRPGAPDIALWLEQQASDPRLTLTIVATHVEGTADNAWGEANRLADQARKSGMMVRIVVREGSVEDLYARLGYDGVG